MRATRRATWILERVAALTPAIVTFAIVSMSPLGAEVALAAGSSASERSVGVVYGGLTSNGWPVTIETTSNGRMIKRVAGAIDAPCSLGGSFTNPSQWRYLRISPTGTFKASYRDDYLDDGYEVEVNETFAAKFNRNRTKITGTWRDVHTFRAPDGTVDVCDSGSLRFTAKQ